MNPYYQDDAVTIYHGDCREVDVPADALVTDPPYGLGSHAFRAGRQTTRSARLAGQAKWAKPEDSVAGDDAPFDPGPWLGYPSVVLWGANHFADRLPPSASWFVWDKRRGDSITPGWDAPAAELAWTNTTKGVRLFSHLWAGYKRDSEIGSHVHPTQKPVALMRWVLGLVTEPGGLVFDPYMGSGPMARACADMDRRYVGVELVEEYCEVAVGRLAQQSLRL